MSTLELLQLQNEHKDNFFTKGEEVDEKLLTKQNKDDTLKM